MDALVRLGGIPLGEALGAAAAVHGKRFNSILTLKALTFFGDGDLSAIPDAVRARLAEAVREVDVESVPNFSARPGLLPSEATS